MLYVPPLLTQDPVPDVIKNSTAGSFLSAFSRNKKPFYWDERSLDKDSDWNWAVTSFAPETEEVPTLVPIKADEPWETIPLYAKFFKPRMLIGIFPTLLQLERRYMATVRQLGYPACLFPPQNAAVAAASAAQLNTEAVVGTQNALAQFETHFANKTSPMRYYQMILAPGEVIHFAPENSIVTKEIHVIPGVVGFFQCEDLARQNSPLYHPSDRFIWEIEGSSIWITDPAPQPRFARILFLNTIQHVELSCSCGRTLHVKA